MNAPEPKLDFRHVGTRPVRPDGVDKVTGKAVYGPDFAAPGMLQGAILRSPHAHARIVSIDTSKAEALPGVKAVVTGEDFPNLKSLIVTMGESAGNIIHVSRKCMAHGKVLFEGHPVAAVAATSAAIAQAAARLIEVEYKVLPHVLDVDDAMLPGAPLLHEELITEGVQPRPETPSNVPVQVARTKGDAATALAEAAVVVEGRYTMPPVHQGYIEPHACVASWNADGQAQIWTTTQGAFVIRALTAQVLSISQADIRVTPLEIGGGFGGKTTVYLEPVAMLLSRKSGRPVRLAMTREEVFRASGPAPGAKVELKIGATADGRLLGAEISMKYNVGAFPGNGAQVGLITALYHYRLDHFSIIGWNVVTNMPGIHAYRAPCAPQVNFAVESAIDELAQKLGMDPIELRLKNAVRPGDPSFTGGAYGEIGYVECLEAAKAHPHWSAPLGPNQGRGVAGSYWMNHGGASTAAVSLAEDGSVLVTTGSPDIGGSRASMAIMAAETLCIPYEKVRVAVVDTSAIGYSMVTGGSRTTYATGKAVIEAANKVIETMKARAAAMWSVDVSDVAWGEGEAICLAPGKDNQRLPIDKIAARMNVTGGPLSAEASVNPHDYLPAFAVHICDTEVDPETGQTSIVRYTTIQDVGRAIHPDYVEGQMQGGASQGIGWALNEAFIHTKDGRLDNPGFLDYRVPVCSDLPMIDTVMVEKPNPAHPYGVKGVGEVPIVPPLATVANAVSRAIGARMRDLPLAPDKVYTAMQAKG
jgi:CO/xanthine dehydrogenase Mo-binding subunit